MKKKRLLNNLAWAQAANPPNANGDAQQQSNDAVYAAVSKDMHVAGGPSNHRNARSDTLMSTSTAASSEPSHTIAG